MDERQQAESGAKCGLSLIIPAYNEQACIRQAILEANDSLAGAGQDYEIIIVDDGSRDGTAAAVEEVISGRPWLRLLVHPINRGYGAALRTGFEAACFDQVAFTDADCQFDLADLVLMGPLLADYPLVVGYRVDRKDPWLRRFLSWGYNQLVRTLLGTRVRDCDCALKLFRREILDLLLPRSQGFFVNAEILSHAHRLGYRVKEVGVRHRPRLHGSSKVSLGEVPRTLYTLLRFWVWQRLYGGRPAFRPSPRTAALKLTWQLEPEAQARNITRVAGQSEAKARTVA
jgi:dolichol-phosphate mannosyltransferase